MYAIRSYYGDYSVPVTRLDHRPELRSRAICYAAAMIARRMGLQDAVARRPPGTSPEARNNFV